MSLIITTGLGCANFFSMAPKAKPSAIYKIDESSSRIKNDLNLEETEALEFRFANSSLSEVVDALNSSDERYTVYLCDSVDRLESVGDVPTDSNFPATNVPSASMKRISDLTIDGLFSGSIPSIVRDIAITNNLQYSSIGSNKFYIGRLEKDLLVDYIAESDLTDDAFEKLVAVYEKIKVVRVGSRVFVRGPFFDVKDFVNTLERFDQQNKVYLVNVVFIRSARGKVNDIKAKVEFETIDLISSGYSLLDVFQAYGAIDCNGRNSRFYLEQELLTNDGVKSKLKIGNDREQEQRSISDQGTSTVSGYRSVNDGIELEITPRASVGNMVDVRLLFSNSKFDDSTTFNRYTTDVEYNTPCLTQA